MHGLRRPFALTLGAALLFAASSARADQPGVALVADAPAKAVFSKELAQRIAQAARVVALEPTLKALTAVGHVGPPAKFLSVAPAPAPDVDRACNVAKRLLADYTVAVQRKSDGKKRSAHIVVVKATPCKVADEREVALPGGGEAKEAEIVATEIALFLGAGGEGPSSPQPAATKPSGDEELLGGEKPAGESNAASESGEKAKGDDDDSPPEPARYPREPIAYVEGGPTFGIRRFTYHDLRATNLFEYRSNQPMFAMRVHGDLFPWARQGGAASAFGFGVELGHSFAGGSTVPGARSLSADVAPNSVETDWTWFDLYAQLRIRLRHANALAFRAGYGHTSFTFAPQPSEVRLVPSVTYGHMRVGPRADLRFLGKVTVHASLDFLLVLDAGTAANRFGNPSTFGAEMMAGGGYQFNELFELFARVSYAHFSTSFFAVERREATGASDQFARGELVGRFAF